MRYLGNKTRLLDQITDAARGLGFERGTVCDLFAGSGVVSRHFRSLGNRVEACDLMESSYTFQRVFLEIECAPSFDALLSKLDLPGELRRERETPTAPGDWTATFRVLDHLEFDGDGVDGLITRQYSTAGESERGYFRPEVARRIDRVIELVRQWEEAEWIGSIERDLLTAVLIDGADRRANISGTYGAYLKKWQSNSEGELRFALPEIPKGPKGRAHHGDACEVISEIEADLLYLDPPYNNRQYAANYHMFEVLVRAIRTDDPAALESSIYGKTGLVPWKDKASKLCSQRGTECRDAMHAILMSTRIPRLVISYSEEGILFRAEFKELLAEYAGRRVSDLGDVLSELSYRRFRSDADGRVSRTGAERQYKQLSGRNRNEVHEWLFHVRSDRLLGQS
ncbi:MAG: DNA adenine methylase [Planctomycetota bacterium]